MRKRFNSRCMDSKIWIKQMSQMNTVCLRNQTHLVSVYIKAPREALFEHIKGRLIFTVQNLGAGGSVICFEDDFYAGGAIPLR